MNSLHSFDIIGEPKVTLSSASAALLPPSADGRLFLSGRRNQRTRIRGLEIVQNLAPDNPSLDEVVWVTTWARCG